jgi:hypothetical protein
VRSSKRNDTLGNAHDSYKEAVVKLEDNEKLLTDQVNFNKFIYIFS